MRNIYDIPIEIDQEIRAANRGRLPRNRAEYERTASRFGCTVQYFARNTASACIEGDVICVPQLRPGERPGRPHIHELAHAVQHWEGREPCILPPALRSVTPHGIARCVDLLEPRRPYLTQALERRISHVAGILANLLEQAGHQTAYVAVNPGRAPETILGYIDR